MQGDARVCVGWCSAHSGSEAHRRIASRAWPDVAPQLSGSPRLTRPPERALAVGRGGVDQDAGHRGPACPSAPGVDALAQAGRGVAALERELAHQRVCEGVQQDVAQAREVRLRVVDVPRPAPLLCELRRTRVRARSLRLARARPPWRASSN